MPRKKKDGRFINYYIDRKIYERLERYADDKSQTVTTALERILDDYLTHYESDAALVERYCPSCHILVHNVRCTRCGRRWLEKPRPEDYCFLTEKDALWAGVLEDCLGKNNIPYLTRNSLGAGLTAKIGSMQERMTFFVQYEFYSQAERLEEELFSSEGTLSEQEDLPQKECPAFQKT